MNLPSLSDRSQLLKGQKMFSILDKARSIEASGKKVYHYELGDPNFNTPETVRTAAIKSIQENNTHYTSSSGCPKLLAMAAEVTLRSRGFLPSFDQLLVTPGANYQIYLALSCMCNEEDEILCPDPGFVSYESIATYLKIKSKFYDVPKCGSEKIDTKSIKSLINSRTKAIIINSPSNPTGVVIHQSAIKEIFEIARSNNLWIISDEIYARLVYSEAKKFYSPSSIEYCRERVLIINGLSKSYAMTGWRIGVATGPSNLIKRMQLLLESSLSCVPPFIQDAACAALTNENNEWKNMLINYDKRRKLFVNGINEMPMFKCPSPDGAFYAFVNSKSVNSDDVIVANQLLEECNIACTPGSYFGKNGKGYLRFAFCLSVSDIQESLAILKDKYC